MKVVLDASVLLAAADAREPAQAERARRLQQLLGETGALVVPALAYYELGNAVLHGLEAAGPEDRSNTVRILLKGLLVEPPELDRALRAHQLAERHALTFCDASYLELADRDPQSLLLTDDRRLLDAARQTLGPDRAFSTEQAFRRFLGEDEPA